MVRRRRSVSLDFFPWFSVGFWGWVVVFSFCFLFVFSTLFRVLDLDLLQSWERERQVFGSSLLPRSLSLSRDHAVFFLCVVHKLLAWLVVSSAIYYKLELLLLWTFKAPHIRELVACWFCVFFPKTFENESLKNFCTSIAVYNPSFISGFASRLHVRRDRQNITALFLLLFHKFTRSDLIEFCIKLCVCCNIYTRFICS